jgi:hypothetical protein
MMELIHVICQRFQGGDDGHLSAVVALARPSKALNLGESLSNPRVKPLEVLVDK